MKVLVFVNALSLGGTEKAACRWAKGLQQLGHSVHFISLVDGPRHDEILDAGIRIDITSEANEILRIIKAFAPDVIHAHAPGHPHPGDILGGALKALPKIPVVQTNIFGHLDNPREDKWTNYRLFISWTSCVQAARRAFRPLDENFFRRSSVAVYPLDPREAARPAETQAFRSQIGVANDEILFGRISRPDPIKWTPLAVDAFRLALKKNPRIKLLLREPPPEVARELKASPQKDSIIILPATADDAELLVTMSALDVVLHTSRLGESFGYGIAEPMNLGKPVITHSVPTLDQAQIELVRHSECGFIANSVNAMSEAISKLANDKQLRTKMGDRSREHIRKIANPDTSLSRLEKMLNCAIANQDNPFAREDLAIAQETATYLDEQQFRGSLGVKLGLRATYFRSRFSELRRLLRASLKNHQRN